MAHEETALGWTGSLGRVDRLTTRQLEVFLLLGHGMSNRQIALTLVVSEHTVKTHIAKILKVLRVESRLQAGLAALPRAGHACC